MNEKDVQKRIRQGREFMMSQCGSPEEQSFVSDQEKKLPVPPLCKEAMTDRAIALPLDFEGLVKDENFSSVLLHRKSSRVYTGKKMSLSQLSFLLYMTQGVKEIRGKAYATLRTVPSGGARHAFETYLLVQNVEGLAPGAYHYLPINHHLEMLREYSAEEIPGLIDACLLGQGWAKAANAVFCWSCVPYRAEWRYGPFAHKMLLVDLGHVGENLYLAATALGLGTCGIGYYDQKLCDDTFGLPGEKEFSMYTQAVGTVDQRNTAAEQDFYQFVKEQGL